MKIFIILKVSKFQSHFGFKSTTFAEPLESGGPAKSFLLYFHTPVRLKHFPILIYFISFLHEVKGR